MTRSTLSAFSGELLNNESSSLLPRKFPKRAGTPLSSSKPATPLKWRPILVLLFLNLSRAVVFESAYPFINQMVYEFGNVSQPEEVGFYSGLIESMYAFSSFVFIMPMTFFSDTYGRKPVIIFGMLSITLSTTLFGLSRTLTAMVLARCVAGTLGGTLSATRTMLAEMTDKTNQDVAYSGLAISLRLGQIIGQPLGGFLSHPGNRWPDLFGSPFWLDYPFALPCFTVSIFTLGTISIGAMHLKETLPSSRIPKLRYDSGSADEVETDELIIPAIKPRPALRSVLNEDVCTILISSFGIYFVINALAAVYPLFAFTPIRSGGLSLSEAQIGMHLAIRSFVTIIAILLFPLVHRRLGTTITYRLAIWSGPLVCLMPPALNLLARKGMTYGFMFNAVLGLFFMAWAILGLGITGSNLLVTDAAPSPEAIGTLVGANQMASVLPQALAPSFVSSIFAYSTRNGMLSGNLCWVLLSTLSAIIAVHAHRIREMRHDWRKEYRDEVEE